MSIPFLLKVGAQTETELKEKKLRVEDALNATKVYTFFLYNCKYIYVFVKKLWNVK